MSGLASGAVVDAGGVTGDADSFEVWIEGGAGVSPGDDTGRGHNIHTANRIAAAIHTHGLRKCLRMAISESRDGGTILL